MEYAFGGNAADGAPPAGPAVDPATRAALVPAPPDRPDATVRIEVSADLLHWREVSGTACGGGFVRCHLTDEAPFARVVATVADGAVLDTDGDGLHDLFEQGLADASPHDAWHDLGGIRPLDDFDGDGTPNLLENDNRAPGPRGNAGPALIDPRRVAAAADAQPCRNPAALEVHTPLD